MNLNFKIYKELTQTAGHYTSSTHKEISWKVQVNKHQLQVSQQQMPHTAAMSLSKAVLQYVEADSRGASEKDYN